ncbi:MAG: hypothetical protein IID37_01685 [Planctomycetes bacterium]|nr:hypothetical protein [Planctomycetota bacterium]
MQGDYPETVIEVIDSEMRFRPATLRAVRAFASSKPWSGSLEKRKEKFIKVTHDLATAYNVPEPDLRFEQLDGTSSGGSYYLPKMHLIIMSGKLSVVTYLHEFAHALGKDEADACRWSINLFRQCFPRQFSRLIHRGHMLIRPTDVGRVSVTSGTISG